MASLTRWTWVWVNSGSWWWTGRPGVLLFMGSQRVGHDWATELNWTEGCPGMEGWLRWFAHYLRVWVQKDMSSILLLLLTPSFFFRLCRNSSWNFLFLSLCIFWSKICPSCTCRQLILISYNFFIFCSLKRGFPGASFILHQRVCGPRPVSTQ